jgi:hypothetical protein
MTDAIFLIDDTGTLRRLESQPYDSEDRLQALIAEHPDLLPGAQINPEDPCRWILVAREMAIADEPGSGGRWSADHLFLDQRGIPTIVEVKRASDTRIRREVIGQLLDYAAHGTSNWMIETIRVAYERECETRGLSPAEALSTALIPEMEYEEFWELVGRNLREGRVRLLLVADRVPGETRRVIEFLNNQMTQTEVLAVEITHLRSGELRALAPRVIGQTAIAQDTKRAGSRAGRSWDRVSYLADMADTVAHEIATVAERLVEWAVDQGITTRGGGGSQGSLLFDFPLGEFVLPLFALYTYSADISVEMRPQFMLTLPGFVSDESRRELLQRLNAIGGVEIPLDRLNKRPSFRLSLLEREASFETFTHTIEWAIETFRSALV